MKTYKVTLHRVVEHETIYSVVASDEEAEALVLSGNYDERMRKKWKICISIILFNMELMKDIII